MTKWLFQKKHNARLALVQCLYAHYFSSITNVQEPQNEVIAVNKLIYSDQTFEIESELLTKLLQNIITEQDYLDKIIEKYLAANWSFNRLNIVTLSILRAAIGEMLYCPETLDKVIIKEYISIADEFIEEKEVKFINAVLDKVGVDKNNSFS